MVNVAQLVEHRTVIPGVECSNHSIHPNLKGVHKIDYGSGISVSFKKVEDMNES